MSILTIFKNRFLTKKKLEPNVPSKKHSINHLKIFIVDDNIAFASIVESFITGKSNQKLNHITFTIKKYHTALECLNNLYQRPDVIILDYFLSPNGDDEMNGDEAFKKIIEFNPSQKVVMLSGLDESNIVLGLIKMGLRDYIIKDDDMFSNLAHVLLDISEGK